MTLSNIFREYKSMAEHKAYWIRNQYWIMNQKGLREGRGKNLQVAEHKDPVRS